MGKSTSCRCGESKKNKFQGTENSSCVDIVVCRYVLATPSARAGTIIVPVTIAATVMETKKKEKRTFHQGKGRWFPVLLH